MNTSRASVSGRHYNAVSYGLDERGRIDFGRLRELALEHRPRLLIAGASAYPRTVDFERFRAVADSVGAYLLADISHIAGLVAVGLHPTSIGHAHFTTTTTHKTLRGPRGGMVMCGEDWAKAVDKAVFPGIQGGPLMHVIAGKAVALHEAMQPSYKAYIQQVLVNAKAMAEVFANSGIRVVSGGTDNHLMCLDMRPVNLTGKEASALLCGLGFTVNKNTIPNDPQSPFVTSGLRIGTPAITTMGMGEAEARRIAEAMAAVLREPQSQAAQDAGRKLVAELCERFPMYPGVRVGVGV